MPEGLPMLVAVLAIGYLLLLAELFVPGGVLGIIGFAVVLFGCYLAFGMGPLWGTAVIVLSIVVSAVGLKLFFSSRAGRALVLDDPEPAGWRSQDEDLGVLLGRRGRALTSLRPSGAVEIGGRRIDVVSDNEYLDAGTEVMVSRVEGGRVVVEAAPEPAPPPVPEMRVERG